MFLIHNIEILFFSLTKDREIFIKYSLTTGSKGETVMKKLTNILATSALASVMLLGIGAAFVISSNKVEAPAFATYTNGDAATYYNSIDETQSGNTLLTALRTLNLSKRQSTVGYSSMGTTPSGQFKYTDYDPDYVQYDSNGQPYGTRISSFYTYTSATSWNREHVWPNSHGGGDGGDAGSPYPDADIHMPRPTISSENSSRGNSFFVEGMNHSSNGWDPKTAGYSEQSRGEAARITFYCTLVNSKLILAPNNTTPSGTDSVTGQSFGSGHTMGNLETLIKWTINYPVTQREKNRNEGAEYLQGNRNPFVDHPEYACKIWGNVNSTIQTMCNNANWSTDGVSISKSSASIAVDGTTTISATSTNNGTISWSSNNTSVATVSSASSASGANITITGVSTGTATITASATINSTLYKATCTVNVTSSGGSGGSGDGDYNILNTDAPSSYPTTATSYTSADGLSFMAYNVMNQSGNVQFKKSGGYLYSTTQLNLSTLTLNGLSGTVTVYAGSTSNPSSTTITGSNGVYNLSGYKYFKIINNSSSVATCSSIAVNVSTSTKTLSSISVSTAPTKTTYTAGETFDPTGLVIKRTYSDSSNDTYTYANHTSEFTFSPSTSTALTTSNTSVTITYGGKSTTQNITVNAAAKTLSSISVSGYTASFTVGDTFSFGGTVTAHFSNSSTSNVTSSATFSGYNMSTAGSQTVTVSYTYSGTTKTTTYSITVSSSGGSQTTNSQKIVSNSSSTYYTTGSLTMISGTNSASADCTAFSVSWLKNSGNDAINVTYAELRIYAQHSFTITPKTGYTITSVVITANSTSYANAIGGSSVTNCTKSVSGSNVTLTPTNGANAVGFTNSAQSRINYIVVNYEGGSSAQTPTSISATASKTYYVGETISASDITVTDDLNNNVTSFTFANDGYQFTYDDAASGGALTNKTFTNAITNGTLTCSLTVQVQRKARGSISSIDKSISYTDLPTAYSTSTSERTAASGIKYIAYNVANYSSKMQFKASGGYIETTEALNLKTVTINDRETNTLTVYGSNTKGSFSTAITGTNDVYDLSGYKYVKIIRPSSNAAYCSSITISVEGSDSAANVANYIMYEDTNNQCTTKFSIAKGYFEGLSSSERSTFMTSTDYVISTARARFQAWAANQGKTISLSGGDYVITGARGINGLNGNLDIKDIAIIMVTISVISLTFVGGHFYLKKKREK